MLEKKVCLFSKQANFKSKFKRLESKVGYNKFGYWPYE